MRVRRERSVRHGIGWGLFFIGLGVVMLLNQVGWIEGNFVRHLWPLWPAVFGVAHLMNVKSVKHVSDGVFLLLLSAWLFVSNEGLWGLDWSRSWPLVLVAIGLSQVVKAVASRWLPEREHPVVESVDVREEEESRA